MSPRELAIRRSALDAAERLLVLSGSTRIPVDVNALVVAQGLDRPRPNKNMDRRESGRLVGIRHLRIYYNALKTEPRQRFTICHELAHTMFLDEDTAREARIKVRIPLEQSLPSQLEESLCESVARSLLMPRLHFLTEIEGLSPSVGSVEYLAERFGVGRRAVLMRIETLNIDWPCAVLEWRPIDTHGRVTGFRLTSQWNVNGRLPFNFSSAAVVSMDGLYKTHDRLGKLAIDFDEQSGLRFESRSYMRRGQISVWSLATIASRSDHRG